MIGGLATIELSEVKIASHYFTSEMLFIIEFFLFKKNQGRPFFFTFFVSNNIKLHPTDGLKVSEFTEKHIGSLVFPPATKERLNELGPFETREFIVEGDSWKKSMQDIVIAGLGWVAVTGTGTCKVKVTVPSGTFVGVRPSLMPFEAPRTTVSFTGGRIEKKSKRPGAKGYG